jgi:hypothetical protein
MPMTNYPGGFRGGVTIRNVPVLNVYGGATYWVHSVSGSDGNRGTFDRPFGTLAFALTQCTSGDVVFVKAGHAESVIAAGTITAVAGVSVIGLGVGRNRPTLTFSTATTATLLVTAAKFSIQNFVFDLTGIDALAGPIAVQAADFSLMDSEIIGAGATNQATLAVLTSAAADRMLIENCRFFGTTDAGMTAAVRLVGGDGITIRNNVFQGAYSAAVGAIQVLTTATTNVDIDNNYIDNQTASSTACITGLASTTGVIRRNFLRITTDGGVAWIGTPGNTALYENYGANNVGERGIAVGTASV